LEPATPHGYAAIVEVHGEHDLGNAHVLEDELAHIFGSVLVDLSACSFLDSTVIGILVRDQHTRRAESHFLELLLPEENTTLARVFEITHLDGLLTIHTDTARAGRPGRTHINGVLLTEDLHE
jgi:anti-anti-sigma factor